MYTVDLSQLDDFKFMCLSKFLIASNDSVMSLHCRQWSRDKGKSKLKNNGLDEIKERTTYGRSAIALVDSLQ